MSRDTDDDDDEKLVSAVVEAVLERTSCVLSDAEARAVAAKVLARATRGGATVHRPARYVAIAIAEEPDLYAELLTAPVPPGRASPPPLIPPCGGCNPQTRMREDAEGRPFYCPDCNPRALERGA